MEVFKDWQLPIVELLLSDKITENNPLRVKDTPRHPSDSGKKIGRSSVQVFLKTMAEEGLLNTRKQPARGGYHGVYWKSDRLEMAYQSLKEV